MKENKNVLDELNKGASMGMIAIDFIYDKLSDKTFKKTLKEQYLEYENISKKVNKIYEKYTNEKPHEVNTMEKMMTWYGIEMKTFKDKSNSKIAELLLKGTNMGIIEGRRLLNDKNVDKKINKLLNEFVGMQEKYVEVLKTYL